jgi:hypothetical protein
MNTKTTSQNSQINERFSQIRECFCQNDNKLFASKIGEKEQNLSSICTGSRPVGLTSIMKLLVAIPEVDANWLLLGKGQMIKTNQGKNLNVSFSPKATVANGDMEIRSNDGIIELLNKQQETIRHLTSLVSELTLQKQSHE